MRNRLFNLFAANARKGEIRAEAGTNTIFLYDFIVSSEADAGWWGGVSAEGFAKLLATMTGPVTVRLNSPGGDVFGGRAIAAAIRGYDSEVTVQIDGLAASAASTIAVAGDKVTIAPDAMIMIHEAWTITIGNKRDHTGTVDLLDKIDATIADGYAAKAGDKAAATDWLAAMEAETWYTAQEALDAGLIDEILPAKADKSGASNAVAWDLSAFANAPKPPAPDQAEPEGFGGHVEPEPEILDAVELTEADIHEQIAARQRRLAVDLL